MSEHCRSKGGYIIGALILLGLGWLGASFGSWNSRAFAEVDPKKFDPKKLTGPDACGECHTAELQAWKGTRHFKAFKALHRDKKARTIAKKMGIRRVKKGSLCLTCHYSVKQSGPKLKATHGVSCESCHGPAKDWIKVHDFYGKGKKKEDETADHKKLRIAKSIKAGMILPSDIYRVAANCFGCHTVPQEKLVNTAGHPAGSDFELVAWSQGEVRHNLFASDGKQNREASLARKRQLYTVGRILDLEFGLRGLAKATVAGDYSKAMTKRIAHAVARLEEVRKAVSSSKEAEKIIGGILTAIRGAQLAPGNAAGLSKVADQVAKLGRQFATDHDCTKLAGLDALLPRSDTYKGKVYTGK
ncbi:cytochrome c family protein [bacterium AH-315-M10]|nr:cytochrome c family protein [bacterium AH-315-M10]